MHGGPQGQHHVRHVLADAGVRGLLHVGGNRRHGRAGAQRHHGGFRDVPEHDADGALAAAEPGEEGPGGEDIDKAQGIVHRQGPGVVLRNLGAVGSHQVGEEAEEGDGGIVGDDLHEFQHHAGQVVQEPPHGSLLAAVEVHGKAEEQGEHNQRQHGPAGQEAAEITGGEEVHNHVRQGGVLPHLLRSQVRPGGGHRREDHHQHIHDDGGDGPGDHEGPHGDAHDLPRPLPALHVRHGAGDGGEDHGDHHAEHQVDEHGAQGLEDRGAGAGYDASVPVHLGGQDTAQNGAQNHGPQHDG